MSRVVFVGNVPYNMTEDQLIDFFKQVGHVVGFRLVYDRETGKPRGYGFCEFGDHQTAQSAVRNLHGREFGGRALRIDLADSDPFLEGRTTVRGEIFDGPLAHEPHKPDILKGLPPGIPVPPGKTALDMITEALTSIRPAQMLDVLAQMKTFVTSYPKQAHELLSHNPQLSFAIFQALILNDVVERSVIQRMQDAAKAAQPPAPAPAPAYQQGPPYSQYPPPMPGLGMPPPMPPSQSHQFMPTPATSGTPTISQTNPYYQQQAPSQVPPSLYQQAVPPPQTPSQPIAGTSGPSSAIPADAEQQRNLLLQLLQLSPDQVNTLAPNDRAVIEQVRNQLLGGARPAT